MDAYARHQTVWKLLQALLRGSLLRRFALESEPCETEGPCIVISNHVTNWDPFLVAMSFRRKQLYYVASEHIFRLPVVSRIICWLLAPIARKKGYSGVETVREILKHTRAGHSVCLFAEGDCSWDGVSGHVPPATGKLVRTSGATLVTYRLEGGYLTAPRWGKGIRRGRMRGHAVGVYGPEELKSMRGEQITALIERDIYEDAYARQAQEPVMYRSAKAAERLESALFLCPSCRRVGTLRSRGEALRCESCGARWSFRPDGRFEPEEPFATVRQWDLWQHEELAEGRFEHGQALFSDPVKSFRRVLTGHRTEHLSAKRLVLEPDCLSCGQMRFPLSEIGDMAMVKRSILLFAFGKDYYELRVRDGCNLRKYLAVWRRNAQAADISKQ